MEIRPVPYLMTVAMVVVVAWIVNALAGGGDTGWWCAHVAAVMVGLLSMPAWYDPEVDR